MWAPEHHNSQLHYAKYTGDNTREMWCKDLPKNHHWKCVKQITPKELMLQSTSNVCFYEKDNLAFSYKSQVHCPGKVYCLLDKRAVVGNESKEGVRLSVTPATNFHQPYHRLSPSIGPYNTSANLEACGCKDGFIAVVDACDKFLDLYDPQGRCYFSSRISSRISVYFNITLLMKYTSILQYL